MSPTLMSGTSPKFIMIHPHHICCPPPNEETVRCDVVCQSITLQNNTACKPISLLLTHIVWLFT